ncbi:8689_t:CDS:1, partial [Entrophospora sp. SA101]
LLKMVPESLESVSLVTIRNFQESIGAIWTFIEKESVEYAVKNLTGKYQIML